MSEPATDRNAPPAMAPFAWDDPFLLHDQLDEDERMISETAAAFAREELAPRVQEAYLEEKVEPGLFPLMGQAGLLGVTIPDQYGVPARAMSPTAWLPGRSSGSIPVTGR